LSLTKTIPKNRKMIASLVELVRYFCLDQVIGKMIGEIPEHFCEVLNSGVGFVRYVFERVMSLN
jgi:hypothetical protein